MVKRRTGLFLLLVILASLFVFPSLKAEDDSVYPLAVDFQTVLVPSRKYDWVYPFSNGYSTLSKNNKVGLCDLSGNEVIAPIYDYLFFIDADSPIQVQENRKYGFINLQGEVILPLQYDNAYYLVDEQMIQTSKEGITSFFSKEGQLLVELPQHFMPSYFSEGLMRVIDLEKGGDIYISTEGQVVSGDRVYERAGSFMGGIASVTWNGELGIIDREWNFTPLPYSPFTSINISNDSGYIWLNQDGLWGCIDRQGNLVVPFLYTQVVMACVSEDGEQAYTVVRNSEGKFGIINRAGDVVTPFAFDEINIYGCFAIGLFQVKQGDLWGLKTLQDEWLLEPSYEEISAFFEGLSLARQGDGWYLLNTDGERVIPDRVSIYGEENKYARIFRDGLCAMYQEGKYGFIGRNGEMLIPAKYDEVTDFGEASAWVRQGELWGILHILAPGEEPQPIMPAYEAEIDLPLTVNVPSKWAEFMVQDAVNLGLVQENLRSNYTSTITRGEFSSLMVRVLEVAQDEEIVLNNPAEQQDDENIAKLLQLGLIAGYGEAEFAADEALSREQEAAFLVRLLNYLGHSLPEAEVEFSDIEEISPWAVSAAKKAVAVKIMNAADGVFHPQDGTTIEQAIVSVLNAYILHITADLPTVEQEYAQTVEFVRQAQPLLSEANKGIFAIVNGEVIPMRLFERKVLAYKLTLWQQTNNYLRSFEIGKSAIYASSYQFSREAQKRYGLHTDTGLRAHIAKQIMDNILQRQRAEAMGYATDMDEAQRQFDEYERIELQQRENARFPRFDNFRFYEAWAEGCGIDYSTYREEILIPENAEAMMVAEYRQHIYQEFSEQHEHLNMMEINELYQQWLPVNMQEIRDEADIVYVDYIP